MKKRKGCLAEWKSKKSGVCKISWVHVLNHVHPTETPVGDSSNKFKPLSIPVSLNVLLLHSTFGCYSDLTPAPPIYTQFST
jgi:hypothetical protein